jgi:gas vesicle protein
MELANSMRGITENIISSYNARVGALGDLVFDTHKTLRRFTSERKKMANDQTKNLTNFAEGLSRSVEGMLKQFHGTHRQMSQDQAKSLAHFMRNLTNDIGAMMGGFHKDREKMSKELKRGLSKEVKEIQTYIKNKIAEFNEAHTEMSQQQKEDLTKFVRGITTEVKKLLADYQANMAAYKNDITKASHAWKGMSGALIKARSSNPRRLKVEAGKIAAGIEEATRKKGPLKTKGKKKEI